MKLRVKDLAVLHAASSDETRYNLNTVRFDAEAGRVYATNGHVLAWVPMPDLDEGEDGLESFSLPAADAAQLVKDTKTAAKSCPKATRDDFGAQLDVAETNESETATIRLPENVQTCQKVEAEYPNVAQIIPEPTTSWLEVAISVDVLKAILKVAKARGSRKALKFSFNAAIDERTGRPEAELGAFRVSAGGPDAEVEFVAMPMRI